MRKGKVELKRIDDKTIRGVCFSKRRAGLFKKADELSILCDVDVAAFVVSNTNKLYEFPAENRLNKILERYKAHVEVKKAYPRMIATENCSENTTIWKCNNILQAVQRYLEGSNVNQMGITDIMQLEHILDSTLTQARKRKTHLMANTFPGLNKEGKKQWGEKVQKEKVEDTIADAEVEDENGKKKRNEENSSSTSSSSEGLSVLREAMLSLA